ncbi:hypothetical protein [Sphingomonas sp. BK235]|uniref:hypothetical protein n=1 Tax=Sphingomonas sp. BK235 TaxID=2512131 RepID=UPI001042E231|nr:hypothetical protein [Sphingomonas sp. BK235]TCP33108.1 hypothetical protein EV292_10650 [Sphingomonas sp. BK235]
MRTRDINRQARAALIWLAPVLAALPIAFYVGGILLTAGAFFPLGISTLSAFGATELALAGWLRLGSVTLLLLPVFVIASILVWPVSRLLSRRLSRAAPRAIPLASAMVVAGCCGIAAIAARGVFEALVALFAAAVFVVLVVALLRRSEAALQRTLRPLRWYLAAFAITLTLPALGEAVSPLADGPRRPGVAALATPRGLACVRPLLLGQRRMLFAQGNRIYLADDQANVALEVGRLPPATVPRADDCLALPLFKKDS